MRILFITATRIGDAVISTAVLRHLVDHHKGAEITVACGPLAQSLFAAVPGVQEVIVLEKKNFARHWFSLWTHVVRQKWDLVVDLRRSLTSFFVRTNQRYILGPDDDASHRVELLSSLFDLQPPSAPQIWTLPSHDSDADARVPAEQPVIAFAPVAARREKTWPTDRFLALGNRLTKKDGLFEGAAIVVVGGEEDRRHMAPLINGIPAERRIDLIGCSDLLTVAAVLKRCALIVANDSGLAHLGAATGQPTVALFGPTRPDLYRPWGPNVAVAQGDESGGRPAITDLTVESAYQTIQRLLYSQP